MRLTYAGMASQPTGSEVWFVADLSDLPRKDEEAQTIAFSTYLQERREENVLEYQVFPTPSCNIIRMFLSDELAHSSIARYFAQGLLIEAVERFTGTMPTVTTLAEYRERNTPAGKPASLLYQPGRITLLGIEQHGQHRAFFVVEHTAKPDKFPDFPTLVTRRILGGECFGEETLRDPNGQRQPILLALDELYHIGFHYEDPPHELIAWLAEALYGELEPLQNN